jgi:hypothetical protein
MAFFIGVFFAFQTPFFPAGLFRELSDVARRTVLESIKQKINFLFFVIFLWPGILPALILLTQKLVT